MNHSCPVCGKTGLPDFRRSHVICSQCNSDLESLHLISSLSSNKEPKRTWCVYGIVLFIAIGGIFLYQYRKSVKNSKLIENPLVQLRDSISAINRFEPDAQVSIGQMGITTGDSVFVSYVVRAGDYPYKIANFFYSNGLKYKIIEKENNLIPPYSLRIGQKLKIKLPIEQ